MAFEVPLEADKVDDLNLFSTFVRAPVIGTLLWILGGEKAREEEQDDAKNAESFLDDNCIIAPSSSSSFNTNTSTKRAFEKGSTLKKAAPSLMGSEISEIGEVRESLDTLCLEHEVTRFIPGQPRKSLSWSDEIGKELVEVCEESAVHEPKPATEQPARPAILSRSRSVRANADNLERSQQASKVLVNNPFLKPTMPYTGMVEPFSSGTAGVESPQWGWYINTTPPTPEMYYARPKHSRKPDSSSDTSEASAIAVEPITTLPENSQPNPVFQSLLQKHKAAPRGWPSVPH